VTLSSNTASAVAVASLASGAITTFSNAINGFVADLTDSEVAALQSNPNVVGIEADRIVSISTDQSQPGWGLDRIDQRALPLNQNYSYTTTGVGVTAYVVDSGINSTHTEFTGRIQSGFTVIADGGGVEDCNGHGTHVSGIMAGTKQPDYGPVIDICTAASLRELTTPALLAVLTPVIVGFGINYTALGAFLAAVIVTGQLMANYLSNAGGAWDNAKKYIEDGHHGGKGSDAHKAAVIGDTVGDPFKDTAGPALNPLIKVMNLVSLLVLPAVISLRDNDGARFAIAGAALVVLIGALAFSSRKAPALASSSVAK
jgi:subtilisin family serine protease